MWFKIHRRKIGGIASVRPATTATTPRKVAAKSSKKPVKRFHWPNLHRSTKHQRRNPAPIATEALPRYRTTLPSPPNPVIGPVPSRIRCGTAVIPIMRASALDLPPLPSTPTVAVKRRPSTASSSSEDHLQKVRRLSSHPAVERFNLVYDDIYSSTVSEDEAIYEEITPPKKRALVIPGSNLDLMQVSAMIVDDSPLKRIKSGSLDTSSRGVYALHGGDWVSVASGIYDDVASSANETDEEFDIDTGIFEWVGMENIPWPMASFGRPAAFIEEREDISALQWLCRESYIVR